MSKYIVVTGLAFGISADFFVLMIGYNNYTYLVISLICLAVSLQSLRLYKKSLNGGKISSHNLITILAIAYIVTSFVAMIIKSSFLFLVMTIMGIAIAIKENKLDEKKREKT